MIARVGKRGALVMIARVGGRGPKQLGGYCISQRLNGQGLDCLLDP